MLSNNTSKQLIETTIILVFTNLISVRFFFKYIPHPSISFGLYLISIFLIFYCILNIKFFFSFFCNKFFLFLSVILFIIFCYFAYSYADNLSKVGKGSVSDDCIKIFVSNIYNFNPPYSNMVGYECSLGPSVFIFYFFSYFNDIIFVILPSFFILIFYFLIDKFYNNKLAIFFTFVNLSNLMFVELSAVGSDFYVIGFAYAFALIYLIELLNHNKVKYLFFFYLFIIIFACSRLPLTFIAIFILFFIYFTFQLKNKNGKNFLSIISVFLIFLIWFLLYSFNHIQFIQQPSHLFKKFLFFYNADFSANVTNFFISSPYLIILMIIFLILIIYLSVFFISLLIKKTLSTKNILRLFILSLFLPMFFLSFIDLNARNFNLATWEGLNYLYLPIPSVIFYLCFLLEKRKF